MINKITRSLMDIMNKIKRYEILSVMNGNKNILIKDLLSITLKQCQQNVFAMLKNIVNCVNFEKVH